MIVTSRTPLRISLFGGGSDYPVWFARKPGAVLGFTIDKYIYISLLKLPSITTYRFRLTYSKLEIGDHFEDITHPVVRAVLLDESFTLPFDCSIQADLPANAGLGSSSSFTVGFLRAIHELSGRVLSQMELARAAIRVESELLNERVGVQDQLHAAFGGFNRFDFRGEAITVRSLDDRLGHLNLLTDWFLLIYTGVQRHASAVLEEQVSRTSKHALDAELSETVALVDAAEKLFTAPRFEQIPFELARMLNDAWELKRRFSPTITTPLIDELHTLSIRNGALGLKLCGAGGGGFLLVIVPPDRRKGLVDAVGQQRCTSFTIDTSGSVARRTW
jgi:D-glycero-alpha-D-manno-heptose-7-phosphate kinase